jgi:hypothetical protein
MQWIKSVRQNISLGLCYIIISLIVGECHPFSLVSMYNSFPDKACTFYLSDSKGTLLPLARYYHYITGDLTHNYNAICRSMGINGGNQAETVEQLHTIAKSMMAILEQRCFSKPVADTVQLHQVYYFLKGDSIRSSDIIIYETGGR